MIQNFSTKLLPAVFKGIRQKNGTERGGKKNKGKQERKKKRRKKIVERMGMMKRLARFVEI